MTIPPTPHPAYKLPNGNVQICFSGGRTSAYMLHQIAEANGGIPEDRCQVVFTNTGREWPQTLDFVAEVGQRWGISITWVEYRRGKPGFEVVGYQGASRHGEPFDALLDAKRYLPNVTQRFCTQDLKIRPANRYLRSLGWNHWTAAVGIRADERHRLPDPTKPRKELGTRWHPLSDAMVSKHDVALFWRSQPFDLRLELVRGVTPRGNCDGCFLKSEASRAALIRDYPERAAWWESAERRIGGLEQMKRRRPDNAQFDKRGSWLALSHFVQRHGNFDFDTTDLLCQADEGECI